MFERGLAALADGERPVVAGVVVNMLRDDAVSARLYEELVAADTSRHVLETAISRSEAFEGAAAAARPIRVHEGHAARRLAASFDDLASELASRLHLVRASAERTGSFMI
jgi:cellulose biosynthesis protein BcsQ